MKKLVSLCIISVIISMLAIVPSIQAVESLSSIVDSLIWDLSLNDLKRRKEAATALGDIGDPNALKPLITALHNNIDNLEISKAIITALGQIGEAEAIEPLLGILKTDHLELHRLSIEAIGELGESGVKKLVELLRVSDPSIRKDAAEVLEAIGWEPYEIENEVYYLIAKEETRRLTEIGPEAIDALIKNLTTGDQACRSLAAVALRHIGASSVKPLIPVLEKSDVKVRRRVVKILGRIGHTRAIEPLNRALQDEDQYVRQFAAEALGEIGIIWDIEPLVNTLEDEKAQVREAAVKTLGRIGEQRVVEPLIAALEDSNSRVKVTAALALGKIGDEQAIKPLTEKLEDEDKDVRSAAKQALRMLKRHK